MLDLETKRLTVSCLLQSINLTISTAMCQHSDTVQCNVILKSDDSHKVPIIQPSALSDIPLQTSCHSTQSPLYNSNKYSNSCYSLLIFYLGTMILMVIGFTSRPLCLQNPFKRSLCGLLFRSVSYGQEESHFSLTEEQKTNQMPLIILLYFLQTQHVSDITMPIIRNSRL